MAEVLLLVHNLLGARVLVVKFDWSIDVSVIHAWTLNITIETAAEKVASCVLFLFAFIVVIF